MLHWSNLSRGVASAPITAAIFNSGIFADFYKACFYAAAGTIPLFLAINLALAGLARKFPAGCWPSFPNDAQRVVFATHIAFCVIFTGTFVPFTVALVRILFTARSVLWLGQASTYRCIAYPLALQLMMYGFEGSLRSVYRVNVFLIIHHLMFCSMLALMLESTSTFVLKVDVILSCFATYEMLLYASLIARKVLKSVVVVKSIMAAGLAFYAFTRLIQAALLIGLFVASYGQENRTSKGRGLWWTSLIMCTLLSLLQCYTFIIYSAIWRHIGRPRLPSLPQHSSPPASHTTHMAVSAKEDSEAKTQLSHEPHDIMSSKAELLPSYMPGIMDTAMSSSSRGANLRTLRSAYV
ncbi:hypothetical protein WJX74_005448 [Apatococcus lobatus]|uniref:TLC domain-containing protein n=1 Tax=Apatococcus lobatus TaxID=904363 RepID=A0AAW1RZR9_9CHLO